MRLSMLGLLRAAYTVVAALVVDRAAPPRRPVARSRPRTHRGGGHCRDPRPAARCARRPRSRLGRRAVPPVANPLGLAALTMMLAGSSPGPSGAARLALSFGPLPRSRSPPPSSLPVKAPRLWWRRVGSSRRPRSPRSASRSASDSPSCRSWSSWTAPRAPGGSADMPRPPGGAGGWVAVAILGSLFVLLIARLGHVQLVEVHRLPDHRLLSRPGP